jgi:hypothetical protein
MVSVSVTDPAPLVFHFIVTGFTLSADVIVPRTVVHKNELPEAGVEYNTELPSQTLLNPEITGVGWGLTKTVAVPVMVFEHVGAVW